jgi:hypothetical protein
MKKIIALAAACIAGSAIAASPAEMFKGKVKEGLYEYKMDMEIPGVPAQFSKHSHTMQNCVTKEDLEKGDLAKNDRKNKNECEFVDMKMSGNTATYKMVCKGEGQMTMDTKTTFRDNGFVSDSKMTMNHGGQVMTTTNHVEGRYLGPCK